MSLSEIISISELIDSNLVPLFVHDSNLVTVPVLPVVTSPATLPAKLPVTSPDTY